MIQGPILAWRSKQPMFKITARISLSPRKIKFLVWKGARVGLVRKSRLCEKMPRADFQLHLRRRQRPDPCSCILQFICFRHHTCRKRSEGAFTRLEGHLGRESAEYSKAPTNMRKISLLLEIEPLQRRYQLHMRGRQVARSILHQQMQIPAPYCAIWAGTL